MLRHYKGHHIALIASKWLNNEPKMKSFLGLRPEPHWGDLQRPLKPPSVMELANASSCRSLRLFSQVTQIFLISTTDKRP